MRQPVYFRELESYCKHDFMQKLKLSDALYEELENFLLDESFLEVNVKNRLSFHFVGVIHFKEHVLFILPKYIDLAAQTNLDSVASQIIKVLFKFIKTSTQYKVTHIDTFGFTKLESDCSLFVLADFIMLDFLDYGFYTPDYVDLEVNGAGEIDWPTTIELNHAIFSNNKPIYSDVYTHTVNVDEQHIVYHIHQAVLQEVSLLFEQFSVLNIFHYPSIQTNYSLEELGDFDYLIQALTKEMQVVFSTQKLSLLQALQHYLELKQSFLPQENIQLFGVKSFHVVWEKVCSQAYGNHYEQFKKWIPKPQWKELHSGKIAEVATIIPDILIYKEHENAFYIIDAKYYTTSFEEMNPQTISIKDNPSVGDVTKQYLYEQTLRKHNKEVLETTEYYNLFIFPTEENNHFFGHVTFDIFAEGFKGIYLYRQNTTDIFSNYLNSSQLPTSPLKNL